MSETAKHRHLAAPYCCGNGIDIGSAGDPVVPTAISIDLPPSLAEEYTTTYWGGPIHLCGNARCLYWFTDRSLDYVYSSHLLEDFRDWKTVLVEWMRPVRTGGYLVLLVPEVTRWAQAVDAGQPCNHNHAHEFELGELSAFIRTVNGWRVIEERFASEEMTAVGTPDYTIIAVFRRA